MPQKPSVRVAIQDHFAELTDPRRREVIYPLINVVTIALCAVICGADDFVAIALWGRTKQKWLAKFLDLSAGIPSHDRFNAMGCQTEIARDIVAAKRRGCITSATLPPTCPIVLAGPSSPRSA